jgi:hypothetical protein
MLSTLIQLAGFACLVVAAAIVSPELGIASAGVALLVIGHAADGVSFTRKRKK